MNKGSVTGVGFCLQMRLALLFPEWKSISDLGFNEQLKCSANVRAQSGNRSGGPGRRIGLPSGRKRDNIAIATHFAYIITIMHKTATLDALFPTVRAGVLSATLLQPDHWWFMTELARYLEVTPSSLQRELESLVASGFLLRRQDRCSSANCVHASSYWKIGLDRILVDLSDFVERVAQPIHRKARTLAGFD
jgi:predicted transcriptional regulator